MTLGVITTLKIGFRAPNPKYTHALYCFSLRNALPASHNHSSPGPVLEDLKEMLATKRSGTIKAEISCSLLNT
jgi:hypothetical protein